MNEDRLFSDYLDPWLEGVFDDGDAVTLQDAAGQPDFDQRVERAVNAAVLLNEAWGQPASDQPHTTDPIHDTVIAKGATAEIGTPVAGTVSRFVIDREIGRGGWGVVYLARDPSLDRDVALKVPHPWRIADEASRERFATEARAAARLDHPGIVQVFDWGIDESLCYLATQYCPGVTLQEWIEKQSGPVSPELAARIVLALARATGHAHDRAIVHRDLKPSNVLVESLPVASSSAAEGSSVVAAAADDLIRVRVTDFGLARMLDRDSTLTESGMIIGTAGFMAPEQVDRRLGQIGPAVDVHALGAILFELLSGQRAYSGEDYVETVQRVRFDPVPEFSREAQRRIVRPLRAICRKCLQKKPGDRYSDSNALADDLQAFLDGRPVAARSERIWETTARLVTRHPRQFAMVVVALLVLAILGVSLQERSSEVDGLTETVDGLTDEYAKVEQVAEDRLAAIETAARNLSVERYAADLQAAATAWQRHDPFAAHQHLQNCIPDGADEVDVRGLEWRVLQALTRGRNMMPSVRATSWEGESLYCVRYSRSGELLAVCGKLGIIRLVHPHDGSHIAEWDAGQGEVNGISFSPDDQLIASAGDDGSVAVFDVASGEEVRRFQAFDARLAFNAEFSPDGSLIAVCGDSPSLRFWSWPECEQVAELPKRDNSIEQLAFSPDGRYVATAGRDRRIDVCDVTTFTYVRSPVAPRSSRSRLLCVDYHPAANFPVAGDISGQLRVEDGVTGTVAMSMPTRAIHAVQWLPDGKSMVTGDDDGVVRLWNWLPDQRFSMSFSWRAFNEPQRIYSMDVAPDGERLAVVSRRGKLQLWPVPTGLDYGYPLKTARDFSPGPARAVQFLPGESEALICCLRSVALMNPATGELTKELFTGRHGWRSAAISTDRRYVVASNEHGLVRYLDRQTDVTQDWDVSEWEIDADGADLRPDCFVAPEEGKDFPVVLYGRGGQTRLAKLTAGSKDIDWIGIDGPRRGRMATPDGKYIAMQNGTAIELWDWQTGELDRLVDSGADSILDFTLDETGTLLAVIGSDRQVGILNVESGRVVSRFPGPDRPPLYMQFNSKEKCVLIVDNDRELGFWRTDSGRKMVSLKIPGQDERIYLSPEARYLFHQIYPPAILAIDPLVVGNDRH